MMVKNNVKAWDILKEKVSFEDEEKVGLKGITLSFLSIFLVRKSVQNGLILQKDTISELSRFLYDLLDQGNSLKKMEKVKERR